MKNLLLSSILSMLIIFLLVSPGHSEVLKGTICSSTGIVGIDMLVGVESVPIIKTVFKSTPADTEGLKSGDKIVAINNKPTYNLNSKDIDIAISDIPGENVHLTIMRNNELLDFNITVMPVHQTSQATQEMYLFY